MTIFLCLVFLAVGYGLGIVQERKAHPRHKHYWEVVDRKEIPSACEQSGQTPGQIMADIARVSGGGYGPDTSSALRLARRETIVEYRCPCGASKVERV